MYGAGCQTKNLLDLGWIPSARSAGSFVDNARRNHKMHQSGPRPRLRENVSFCKWKYARIYFKFVLKICKIAIPICAFLW